VPQNKTYPELPPTALSDKLLEEPLVTRVSGLGFLDTVAGDWFSALRFFTAHKQASSAVSTFEIY